MQRLHAHALLLLAFVTLGSLPHHTAGRPKALRAEEGHGHNGHAHARNQGRGAMAPWGATDAPRMFAGFYQAYSRPAAADKVLELFRQWYPRARLLMVNDGGDKVLRQVAEKYHAEYWYVAKVKNHGEPDVPLLFANPISAATLISYLIQAAGDAEWVINLEDDVHVLRPIDPFSLRYDLNGFNKQAFLPDKVQKYITEQGMRPVHWNYGGCGGSIFRGAFLRMLHRSRPWIQQVRHIYAAVGDAMGVDQVISSLVVLNGGSIGGYPGFAEMWYDDLKQRLDAGEVQVLHQNKSLYNAPYTPNPSKRRRGH